MACGTPDAEGTPVLMTDDSRFRELDARFAADPDALEWARGHIRKLAARYREFEAHARGRGDSVMASQWRKFANLLEMELTGGTGCVIRPFDERRPRFAALDKEKSDG